MGGSPRNILGLIIRFDLTNENITLPVEALVPPYLSSDRMLIDNCLMEAFGARLDWKAETQTFSNSGMRHTYHNTLHVQLWPQAQKK